MMVLYVPVVAGDTVDPPPFIYNEEVKPEPMVSTPRLSTLSKLAPVLEAKAKMVF